MGSRIDRSGQTFGRWLVLSMVDQSVNSITRFNVRCECGNEAIVLSASLRAGISKSCGCYRDESRIRVSTIHGGCVGGVSSPEYKVWLGMRDRCLKSEHKSYSRYGGRGIKICDRWSTFANFIEDMGKRPSSKYQIDRIDNNSDYSPDNCRWTTAKLNCRNKSNNLSISFNGETRVLADWLEHLKLPKGTYRKRITTGKTQLQALGLE